MVKYYICLGDRTSGGGVVVEGNVRKYEIDPINSYEQNYLSDYRQYVALLKGDIAPRFLECYDHMFLKQAKKIKSHLVSEIIRGDS